MPAPRTAVLRSPLKKPVRYEPRALDTRGTGIPWPAMALGRISAGGSTRVAQVTRNLNAGDKLFVVWTGSGNLVTLSSLTNDGGYALTWESFSAQDTAQGITVLLNVVTVPAGGISAYTTFTGTMSTTWGQTLANAFTVSGLRDLPADVQVSVNTATGAPSIPLTSTHQQDEFIFSVLNQNGAASPTGTPTAAIAAGELWDEQTGPAANRDHSYGEWSVRNPVAAYTSAPTMTVTTLAWCGVAVAYKIANGAPSIVMGQPVEIDSVIGAFTKARGKNTGQALETDTVIGPLVIRHGVTMGQPVETDSPGVLTAVRRVPFGQALETDTANALTVVHARVVVMGQAVETDTANAMTHSGGVLPPVVQVMEEPGTVWNEDRGGTRAAQRPRGLKIKHGW